MVYNLSDYFTNALQEESSFVDEFIENAHVRVRGYGIDAAGHHSVRNFMFPDFLIVHYKSGTVQIHHGEKATILTPESLYIFKPYEVYSGIQLEDTPISFSFLQFEVTPYIQRYNLMKTALSLDESLFDGIAYRRIGILLDELVGAGHMVGRRAMLGQLAKWTAVRILSDRLSASDKPVLLKENRESRLINSAIQYVSDHISEPIVIGEIAESIGTSRTSLERAFRNTFDLSPQRALLRLKVERSFQMLQQNLPIRRIAGELGFSSEYHFSNAFKSIMGKRPSEYRLQANAGQSFRAGETETVREEKKRR